MSHLYKLITIEYKNNLGRYSVFSLFFWSLSHIGSLTIYSSLRIILILHLLIVWALTWVPVPSDTFFGFLWVVIAKVALFRGLLHINVTRKVAAMYSMRWWQFFLRYFLVPLLLICSWCKSLPLELLRRSPWLLEYIFELYYLYPRRYSSLDHLPIHILFIKSWVWIILYHLFLLGPPTLSDKAQGSIYNLGPWPYN